MPPKKQGADAPSTTENPPVVVEASAEPSVEPSPAADPQQSPAPVAVQLTHPYAFYDEDGSYRSWNPGQKVTGSDAELLIERRAPVVEVV